MSQLVLLGPQRQKQNVAAVTADLGLEGPFAVITAGWQEREAEDDTLADLLDAELVNLALHRRGETLFREDPDFRDAHRTHMEQVKRLQDSYRVRLACYIDAIQALLANQKLPEDIQTDEVEAAYQVVRDLDQRHITRIAELHEQFHNEWPIDQRPATIHHFNELGEQLDKCSAVIIAGGHVAVLLNRLRLFRMAPLLAEKPVIAWSAGAMCLGHQVVLFHDDPPQGKGYAEMFETGLGLYNGVLALPHASNRLLLDDPKRVSLFARRFKDSRCLTMDDGARIDFHDGQLTATQGVKVLEHSGKVEVAS